MRAICRVCKKAIVLVEENSSVGKQWRFREHGQVRNRCIGARFRYFLHELIFVPFKESK